MRNVVAIAGITILALLMGTNVSADKGTSDRPDKPNWVLELQNEREGKSVFGFSTFSTFSDIKKEFECEKYKDKGNTIFKNSKSDWVTHTCKNGDKKLILQLKNKNTLTALRGIYKENRASAKLEIEKIIKLLGSPDRKIITESGERIEWGQWGLYDETMDRQDLPQYFFRVDVNYEKILDFSKSADQVVSFQQDQVQIYKTLINNEKYQEYTSFNRQPIWDGIFFIIQWSFLFFVWWFSLKWHVSELKNEAKKPTQTQRKVILARTFTLIKIVAGCAVVSIILGQGGETCSSYDIRGCTEYSGDYRVGWTPEAAWEFFVKLFAVSLLAWIMALRGHTMDYFRR